MYNMAWIPFHVIRHKNNGIKEQILRNELRTLEQRKLIKKRWNAARYEFEYAKMFGNVIKTRNITI